MPRNTQLMPLSFTQMPMDRGGVSSLYKGDLMAHLQSTVNVYCTNLLWGRLKSIRHCWLEREQGTAGKGHLSHVKHRLTVASLVMTPSPQLTSRVGKFE